jgi:hypothetical protein
MGVKAGKTCIQETSDFPLGIVRDLCNISKMQFYYMKPLWGTILTVDQLFQFVIYFTKCNTILSKKKIIGQQTVKNYQTFMEVKR